MSQPPVYYFDNNATTRVAPEVIAAMTPFLAEYWGNPSSAYSFGHQLVKQVEEGRSKVAAPKEWDCFGLNIFLSRATHRQPRSSNTRPFVRWRLPSSPNRS